MLAQRFADLLPPMSDDEALEAAAIASLAGRFTPERWRQRPTARPHHTASAVALVGGGCGFHQKTELHNKILNSGGSPQHISFPH